MCVHNVCIYIYICRHYIRYLYYIYIEIFSPASGRTMIFREFCSFVSGNPPAAAAAAAVVGITDQ